MNPAAVLALLGALYEQITTQQAEISQLRAELAEAARGPASEHRVPSNEGCTIE